MKQQQACYQLSVHTSISSAHYLRDYVGKCGQLHGHNWKIELEVSTDTIDAVGMGVDFALLKKALRELTEPYDHVNLNAKAPFDRLNPTVENMAHFFYDALAEQLNGPEVRVSAVTVWESDKACVRYSAQDGNAIV